MKRSLWILSLVLLAARPCQAKEKETAVSPSSDRTVMVSWEDDRVAAKKETRGGALIAWEPNRSAQTSVAPPTIPPIFKPSYGAHQFDIEETPFLMPSQGATQAPSRALPAAAAFTPHANSAVSQRDPD
jgi:hypothetical protein